MIFWEKRIYKLNRIVYRRGALRKHARQFRSPCAEDETGIVLPTQALLLG
jgi:hypothetical protein